MNSFLAQNFRTLKAWAPLAGPGSASAVHCCYGGHKNVLSFFACMYRSMPVDTGNKNKKNFWPLQSVEKLLQSLGFEPMTLHLQ